MVERTHTPIIVLDDPVVGITKAMKMTCACCAVIARSDYDNEEECMFKHATRMKSTDDGLCVYRWSRADRDVEKRLLREADGANEQQEWMTIDVGLINK